MVKLINCIVLLSFMIDISWPLTEDMTRYKKRKLFHKRFFRVFSKDKARQSLAALDSHAGTHIDAPAHYVKSGKTIDKVSLNAFNGRCRVLDLSKVKVSISKEDEVKRIELVEHQGYLSFPNEGHGGLSMADDQPVEVIESPKDYA